MSSASLQSHAVRIWKNNTQTSFSHHTIPSSCHVTELRQSITVIAWNCRGLHNSVPYVHNLTETGYDIIILEEHWLWPYELTNLKSLHLDFSYTAVSDKRLNPSSDLTRGCGGVAIVWRTSLRASALKLPDSDRLCGLRVELSDPDRSLHILGVCTWQAQNNHKKCTVATWTQLNTAYPSSLQKVLSLFCMGDLNAHLGTRDQSNAPNHRGSLWNSIIEEH